MRVMILRKADPQTEAGALPTPELFEAMMRYTRELMDAGVMLSGDGLLPTAQGARVAFRGGVPTVTDGPFAETKELIAGVSVWNVASLDEAIAWVRRWPVEDGDGNVEIEIRPMYEADGFGEEFTETLRAQEERLRALAANA
ncbi:MAG TPA: YciI family protein [Longimicrobium sp.]|jgi:hypothetical protein